ncbi:MAG: hypothetical protein KDD58_04000 [Bdellovibrionales bacterium]|nr:hypothetical protein [Bdellovibrionales bacterium]
MNIRNLKITNYIAFLFINLALTSLQCSLWLQFFGFFPSPYMWLPTLAYWAIYREIHEGLFFSYFLVIETVALSSIPLSLFLLINLFCFGLVVLIKQRIYWSGPTYLMLISGIISIAFPIFHFFLSWAIEPKPISDTEILDGILSSLFTSLVAMPLYYLYSSIDKITNKSLPTEAGASKYE